MTWNLANSKLSLNDCNFLDKLCNKDIIVLGVQVSTPEVTSTCEVNKMLIQECSDLSSSFGDDMCLNLWKTHQLAILGILRLLYNEYFLLFYRSFFKLFYIDIKFVVSGKSHFCIANHKMGGLYSSIFIKNHLKEFVDSSQHIDIPCGIGNILSNKGTISIHA
jgi:hypothetical protein